MVTFLFIELIFIGVVLWFVNFNLPGILLDDLKKEAPQVAPYFIHGTPDREELTAATWALGDAMPTASSSTAQDLARSRPTEIDSLNGYVVRRGKELGIPTPVNSTLYALVRLIEKNL